MTDANDHPQQDAAVDDLPSRRTPPAVAVVDAQFPGNVGTISRAMKNFGFSNLLLIDPPELDPDGEAYGFAGHARDDVLPNATEISFDELVSDYHTIGCTAVTNENDRSHMRFPFSTPADLAERLPTVEAPTALVFGRERVGLTNEELAHIDEICAIPASEEYPVLNLGQAATITLYELRSLALDKDETQLPDLERVRADEATVDRLYDQWADLLEEINHPPEKREKTMRMLRRVYGRADLTEREANTFLGLLRRATERPAEQD
ncbi:tRNA (cytidine/uridine-2'-O-)-methyltransferase [Natrialba magadii ATCC 43099]|uniref:TrmH family RNA methyltransferase n=1 Tax=Natrialba magadii (strain ATCC 43099 / DSM 3394 / CCM 3739 / CIP 104546 / IAM 13178 / JCM 8861 / NBRC 102185 / NCIMB 2190 / MS3) TaxID=547559 RepID=D3SU70_NATMM|nr:RNA methyltransferase [Natrialba magadii]ADD07159.1 tRNA (cytidine/uridine-2'-O-)-methyltransferase [Natrialba magadii ATCC 43099]ELY29065.1 TrmH family RNA methyltransferase [Natrialba magadii ATCC 43099]